MTNMAGLELTEFKSDSESEEDELEPQKQISNHGTTESNESVEDYDLKSFDTETVSMQSPRPSKLYRPNTKQLMSDNKNNYDDTNSDDNTARGKKRRCTESSPSSNISNSSYSSKAQKMMKIMGFKEGSGLGKREQGRKEPVELSTQRGRRGLGVRFPGLEAARKQWDPTLEKITIKEDQKWLENTHESLPCSEELNDWLKLGPKKFTIEDEVTFVDEHILKDVVASKSVFDNLERNEIRRARTSSNPFETIRGAFFLNRAAVKMANIDKAFDFCFTKPEGLQPDELLYFADVCAGPGGFSEYVLFRKNWNAKGFGFTLKGENDFKLDEFYAAPCETFHPYYGPKDNGDVYDPVNQEAFYQLVMEETRGKKLHFMMADGGFSVDGQQLIQEILSKQLYLCQCLVALMVVRDGGHFVTKLFDLFTPFSAGLIYLMYRCFDRVCIFKPNTSRPANSERYLICQGKRPDLSEIIRHLSRVNKLLSASTSSNEKDVIQLVSMNELENEKSFIEYLTESNNSLGQRQIIGLMKIAAFSHDPNLSEPKQAEIRKECLAYWELPVKTRTAPRFPGAQARLQTLLQNTPNTDLKFLSMPHTELTSKNIETTLLCSPYDWFCMPSTSGQGSDKQAATFYMGLGRSNVFRFEKGSWIREPVPLELPRDTLIYGEMVNEMRGQFRSQLKIHALHILDAYFLGGTDVSQLHLAERSAEIRRFCEALRKPREQKFAQIRAKNLYEITDGGLETLCSRLEDRMMKNGNSALAYIPLRNTNLNDTDSSEAYYFVTNSILFLKGTAQPFARYLSRSTGHKYYFDPKSGETNYDRNRPTKAVANFCESFKNRLVLFWSSDLSKRKVCQFIENKCNSMNGTAK